MVAARAAATIAIDASHVIAPPRLVSQRTSKSMSTVTAAVPPSTRRFVSGLMLSNQCKAYK